jgi:hypothetical protein
MKYLVLAVASFLSVICANAQQKVNTPTPIKYAPRVVSTNELTLKPTRWNLQLRTEVKEHEGYPKGSRVEEIKERLAAYRNNNKVASTATKTRSNNVIKGKNFIGNKLRAHTPSDNTIAISKRGIIVSCDNDQLIFTDTNGTILVDKFLWNDYLDSASNLLYGKYDPRVVYDNNSDRFIIVILHAPVDPNNNSIIVGFSKTNDPQNGWNIYNLPGNVFNDTSWVDFPNVGINKNELFITLNMFKSTFPYYYNQSIIYQVGTAAGYNNATNVPYKVWGNVTAPDGYPGFTTVPAQNGWGKLPEQGMYLLNTRIDTGNQVYYYHIDKPLTDPTAALNSSTYTIAPYMVCANALIKDTSGNGIDSISTGVAWVQSAYEQDSQLHFIFCANIDTGWCGLQYGKLNLKTNTIAMNGVGFTGTSLCYPAIASIGHTEQDHSMAVMYCQADLNTSPAIGAFGVNNNGAAAPPFNIKSATTELNLIAPNNQTERWGDYSGMQRHYGPTKPEVWLAGSFADDNDSRPNTYNTWIAQLKTDSVSTPIAINELDKQNDLIKVFPSPAYNEFAIHFETATYEKVNITLVDARGAIVKTLFDNSLIAGKHELSFNTNVLSKGNYFVRVQVSNKPISTKQLVVQ